MLATIDPALFSAPDRAADGPAGRRPGAGSHSSVPGRGRPAGSLPVARAPLVVVIDDVQALDEETAGLLAVAMPELTAHGVLFVLGLRIEEGEDASARVDRFMEGVRRDAVVRITLANLTSDEVAEDDRGLAHRAAGPGGRRGGVDAVTRETRCSSPNWFVS